MGLPLCSGMGLRRTEHGWKVSLVQFLYLGTVDIGAG